MKHERPVRELLAECAAALPEPFSRAQVLEWFRTHHPAVSPATIGTDLSRFSSTHGGTPAVLDRVERGAYRPARALPPPDVVLLVVDRSPARPGTVEQLFGGAVDLPSGRPWYLASTRWGLIAPDEVCAPWQTDLGRLTAEHRVAWAALVTAQLAAVMPLTATVVVLHGPAPDRALLGPSLAEAGAVVVEQTDPVGRTAADGAGQVTTSEGRTADGATAPDVAAGPPAADPAAPAVDPAVIDRLVARLGDGAAAVTGSTLARQADLLDRPGLYSWWVDEQGAAELSAGLGLPLPAGIVHVGLAGARAEPAPRGARAALARLVALVRPAPDRPSELRRTLTAVLADGPDGTGLDAAQVGVWMHEHLRVVAVPLPDDERVADVARTVVSRLDPPLTLDELTDSPIRARLRQVRGPD